MGIDGAKHASNTLRATFLMFLGWPPIFVCVAVAAVPIWSETRPGTACAPSAPPPGATNTVSDAMPALEQEKVPDSSGLKVKRLALWTLNPAIAVQIRARPLYLRAPWHHVGIDGTKHARSTLRATFLMFLGWLPSFVCLSVAPVLIWSRTRPGRACAPSVPPWRDQHSLRCDSSS